MDHQDTRTCDLLVEPSEPQLQGLGIKKPKTLEMEQREPGPRSLARGQLICLQLGVRSRVLELGIWSRSYSVMWEVVWYVWGFKVYLVWVPLHMPLVLPLIPAAAKSVLSQVFC